MQMIDNVAVWGSPVDEGALRQIKTCYYIFGRGAMMADHHKGYAVPIGGVVAHENLISPSGVGYDIGCGNKAVLTDAPAAEVRSRISTIMDDIWSTISFGLARKNRETVDDPLFEDDDAWQIAQGANSATWRLTSLRDMARAQLGTVGSGNHFVDILEDEAGRIWIGVHFGSRGFGHKIATRFLTRAGAKDEMDAPPAVLDARTNEGQDYIAAMKLAGRYAYAGRDWVCDRVSKILGARVLDSVHNHHNFAWRENHGGTELWVVRKGATPAFPGQRGFVGGSMGDVSVIIEGVENDLAGHSLYSTVHGAGRVMGRMEAKGKYKNGVCLREGKVKAEDMRAWVEREGVELRGAGLDEAPQCYKRLPAVLAAHEGTIRVVHTLRPIGVAMAGADVFDPFKD
ncbi:MAG: RtcB family protein [Candidatus Solibacter usitatus]|nr:RtcB family protein [Candidatus Solibacter usitatus]